MQTDAAERPPAGSRRRATAAHLWGIANVAFSLAGLLAALIVLKTNAPDPFVRAHARTAINMQLTWLLFAAIVSAIYVVAVFDHGAVVRVADVQTGVLLSSKRYWTAVALFGSIVVTLLFTIACNVIGGVAASAGRPYRYPLAIAFLR